MDRFLVATAFGAALLTMVAGIVSLLLVLRMGAVPADSASRLALAQAHGVGWRASWVLWGFASVTLVAFYAALAPQSGLGRAALVLGTTGLGVDLSVGTSLMAWLPSLPVDVLFLEPWSYASSAVVANGLYTAAGAAAVVAAWRAERLPGRLALASAPAWLAGAAVSATTLGDVIVWETVAAGALVAFVSPWLAAVGAWAWRES